MSTPKLTSSSVSSYIISALCVVVLIITLGVMATTERVSKPQNINGDVVGPEQSEPIGDYAARADQSLADATAESRDFLDKNSDAEKPKFWALVTFSRPGDAELASSAVSDVPGLRVASMVLGAVVTRDLPEPVPGTGRIDVFDREMQHLQRSSGLAKDDVQMQITGLLIYGDIDMLQAVRKRADVAAVESLPMSAVQGRFGVRTRLITPSAPQSPPQTQPQSQSDTQGAPEEPVVPAEQEGTEGTPGQ